MEKAKRIIRAGIINLFFLGEKDAWLNLDIKYTQIIASNKDMPNSINKSVTIVILIPSFL